MTKRVDVIFASLFLDDDAAFEKSMDMIAPPSFADDKICIHCGKRYDEHKYRAICPLDEYKLFEPKEPMTVRDPYAAKSIDVLTSRYHVPRKQIELMWTTVNNYATSMNLFVSAKTTLAMVDASLQALRSAKEVIADTHAMNMIGLATQAFIMYAQPCPECGVYPHRDEPHRPECILGNADAIIVEFRKGEESRRISLSKNAALDVYVMLAYERRNVDGVDGAGTDS